MDIGERIKKIRNEKRLSTYELSKRAGVSQSTVSKLENGKRKADNVIIEKLAEALEVSPDRLTGESVSGIIDTRIKELNLSLEEVAKKSGVPLSWIQNIDDYIPGYYEPYEFGYNRITKVAKAISLPAGTLRAALAKQEIPAPDNLSHVSAAEAFKEAIADFQESDTDEDQHYYINEETRQIAQDVFENPELRTLFKVARDIPPERLKAHIEFMKNLKEQENKHDDGGC